MSSERINIKDVIRNEFYQLPKVFFWKQEYRENLTHGAKLLYMLINDRFSLSIYTVTQQKELGVDSPAYVDDEGFIYCILDNQEIEFTLNISNKTVQNYIKELLEMDLIVTVPEDGGANKIYLKKLDTSGASQARFNGEKEYFKHVKARKRKKKEPTKTLEECIAKAEGKTASNKARKKPVDNSAPKEEEREEESEGSDILPNLPAKESTNLGKEETPNLDGEETTNLGSENLPGQVGQKVPTSNNNSSDLDSSEPESIENDPSDIDTRITQSSSSKIEENPSIVSSEDTIELEEEENEINGKTLITVSNNYALIEHIDVVQEICHNTKDFNVLKKTLIENKIESFPVMVAVKAAGEHARNVLKAEKENDPVRYEPVYYANNLVDAIRRYEKRQQAIKRNETNRRRREQYQANLNPDLLYNWLEN